jgi:hypothetical protein
MGGGWVASRMVCISMGSSHTTSQQKTYLCPTRTNADHTKKNIRGRVGGGVGDLTLMVTLSMMRERRPMIEFSTVHSRRYAPWLTMTSCAQARHAPQSNAITLVQTHTYYAGELLASTRAPFSSRDGI